MRKTLTASAALLLASITPALAEKPADQAPPAAVNLTLPPDFVQRLAEWQRKAQAFDALADQKVMAAIAAQFNAQMPATPDPAQ